MAIHKSSITLPSMTPGTQRSIPVLRFGKAGARPKVYMQAAIHANEMPGTMAMHHLMPLLAEADKKGLIQGEIILVPTVNPIGQAQLVGNSHAGRYNLLSYENFNRNWIDLTDAVAERVGKKLGADAEANVRTIRKAAQDSLKALKPLNELGTLRVEVQKLSCDADFVLDLHCDIYAALHLFGAKNDVATGTLSSLAADLGVEATMYNDPYPKALTFSGVNSVLWARLAEQFPKANIPQACMSVTVEMRSQHDVSDALGQSDAQNLYRWLVRQGVVGGQAAPLKKLKTAPAPMSGMDVGYSTCTGFLVFHVKPGAKVKKGQAICDVIDPANPHGPKGRTTFTSQTDGVLFSRRLDGYLSWPGQVMYRISGPKPLPHRIGATGLDD
ncbi:succinylglutamate desuccinylase/aspartoacylase family protein [Limnohabitans sp. 2KL-3]|uniref:succinylglutamate desuccinylase/aspartoacylase family protein n=1 Tax=Limnohabitans sp. 2KL-3 TaxID=1100700 RepID=UPI000B0890C8|nr:succinylglutamate desuccinylase/aspartoacylase family protein [Limnohabitans sp. 2KL-3]